MLDPPCPQVIFADVSDIFYFFSAGRGKGEFEAAGRGGGVRFFIENPTEGGGLQEGKGPRGQEGGCGRELGIFGGGGAKYFFSGPKCPPSNSVIVSARTASGEN